MLITGRWKGWGLYMSVGERSGGSCSGGQHEADAARQRIAVELGDLSGGRGWGVTTARIIGADRGVEHRHMRQAHLATMRQMSSICYEGPRKRGRCT
jgi:hypothetical protein